MGNSASNASNPPRTIRGASPAPSPGVPHPSLRTKKKSLELPDLASLSLDNTRGRQAKTASIPIPISTPSPFRHYQQCQYPQPEAQPRAPRHLPSTADVDLVPNYPSVPRPNPAAPRGRQQQQQVARMQELYNQSQQPAHSPSHHRTFQQETVRSSIPVALTKALPNEFPPAEEIVQQEYPQKEDLLADFVPVKIIWKGGGTQVLLARASDDEWKGRQPMEKEPGYSSYCRFIEFSLILVFVFERSANVWTITVMLRPGTHHVRFMVDGQWRVADDIPAAVDDQGSLANYVAVPIPALPSPPAHLATVPREKLFPGQSFWSADSSADGEYQQQSLQQQQQQQQQTHSHATHSGRWTNILPPELIEAALEEEAYLSASAGHYDSSSNTRVTTGFIPAPNIPPAPGLPRHLEKLILNTRVGAGMSGVAGSSAAGAATRAGSGQASGGVGAMGVVGSGQGQAARNRDRDRDRERDRERERGERGIRKRATTAAATAAISIPPPPPPSEDGSVPPSSRVPASSPETSLIDAQPTHASSATTPSSTSAPTISTNPSTPPQTPLPSSAPVAPMSPIWSKDLGKTYGGGENGNGIETSPAMSPTKSPPTLHGNISTSTSANVSATNSATASPNPASPNPSTNPTSPATPASHFLSPSASASYSTPTGSRTITIDSNNMPALSDDGSVLPVPSHVVLHHLSTSAIRNGVLAVGNTIRYRKKVGFLFYIVLTNLRSLD